MPSIWMDVDAALSEVPVNILPLIDDTDFKAREVSIAYNAGGMDLVWNFVTTAGAMTQTAVTPTTGGAYDWAHQGDGMYSIEIPASGGGDINNDTEGFGWFTGFATGVLPWRGPIIGFRAAGLNDLLIDSAYSATRGLAGTALPDAVADAAGGLPISDAGGLGLDALNTAAIRLTAARAQVLDDWINAGRLDLLLDAIKAVTDNLPDSGALTTIGTDTARLTAVRAAILTDWIDGGRLDLLLDAMKAITDNLPDSGALTTIGTDTARLTAVRAAILTDWIDGGRLDLLLDALSTHSAGDVADAVLDETKGAHTGLLAKALPDAAPDAAGGLPISDAGGLDLDAMNTAAVRLSVARAQVLDDWINAGRLDLLLDAIKAVTDNLPDSGALTTIGADTARLTAVRAAILTDWIDGGRLDLLLDAIKAVTDNLPDSGALTTIGTDTARLTAVRAAVLTDWINGGRLDLLLDALATAANLTTLLNRIGAFTGSGVNTVLGLFKALLNKAAATPSDVGGTFDPAADSTEAISEAVATVDANAIADQVWNEATADHQAAGSTGKALTDAQAAGDPWATALPGAYSAGTAGSIIGGIANLAATIWGYVTRTLTQSAASVAAAVAGSAISVKRGDTISASLTGLGGIVGRSKLWFTVKTSYRDRDSKSIIQIEESVGLLYLNGISADTPANGSVTVDDENGGDITIALDELETAKLETVAGLFYDVQVLISGNIQTLTEGTLNVTSDITRATS